MVVHCPVCEHPNDADFEKCQKCKARIPKRLRDQAIVAHRKKKRRKKEYDQGDVAHRDARRSEVRRTSSDSVARRQNIRNLRGDVKVQDTGISAYSPSDKYAPPPKVRAAARDSAGRAYVDTEQYATESGGPRKAGGSGPSYAQSDAWNQGQRVDLRDARGQDAAGEAAKQASAWATAQQLEHEEPEEAPREKGPLLVDGYKRPPGAAAHDDDAPPSARSGDMPPPPSSAPTSGGDMPAPPPRSSGDNPTASGDWGRAHAPPASNSWKTVGKPMSGEAEIKDKPSSTPQASTAKKRSRVEVSLVFLDENSDERDALPLRTGKTIIGRTEGEVLLRDDPFVSPWHAQLTVRRNGVTIKDMYSLNGIYKKVARQVELEDRDRFLVGQQVIRFRQGWTKAEPDEQGTRPLGGPVPNAIARVLVLTDSGEIADQRVIRETLTIGRAGCDLSIPEDAALEDKHAQIAWDGTGFIIIDLNSRDGIYKAIRHETDLHDGDVLQIGKQRLLVRMKS